MELNKLMELVADSKFRLPEDLKKYAEEKLVRLIAKEGKKLNNSKFLLKEQIAHILQTNYLVNDLNEGMEELDNLLKADEVGYGLKLLQYTNKNGQIRYRFRRESIKSFYKLLQCKW